MSRKWVVLCKDAHAVDFFSYYNFSPLAFFHLYFFTVDFLPFRLLVCWLFIIFDFFTIGFYPYLLFTIDFLPFRLLVCWLFAVSTFSLLTFISFDFFTVDFPFRPSTRRLLGPLTFDFWLSAPLPAPCWGGGRLNAPPLRFFEDSKKTAARSAAGFSPTLPPIFSATFVKIST